MNEDRHVYIKFFPTDWRADQGLALCTLAARGLWIELLCLAHRNDGYVLNALGRPPEVPELARMVRATPREVVKLLIDLAKHGVCSTTSDGVLFSRRLVKEAKRRETNQRNGLQGGNPALKVSKSDNRKSESRISPPLTESVKPYSPESTVHSQSPEAEGAQRAPAASGNPHAKPTNLVNGADQRTHGMHAWCGTERRMCVPWGLHNDLKARSGKADADLFAWYAGVIVTLSGQPIGDDLFDFWRNHFAEWVGTVTSKPAGRTDVTSSNLRGLREDLAALDAMPDLPALKGGR